jgi:hypothetical protein
MVEIDVVLDVSVEVEGELEAVDVEVDVVHEVGVTTVPQGSISVSCRC